MKLTKAVLIIVLLGLGIALLKSQTGPSTTLTWNKPSTFSANESFNLRICNAEDTNNYANWEGWSILATTKSNQITFPFVTNALIGVTVTNSATGEERQHGEVSPVQRVNLPIKPVFHPTRLKPRGS